MLLKYINKYSYDNSDDNDVLLSMKIPCFMFYFEIQKNTFNTLVFSIQKKNMKEYIEFEYSACWNIWLYFYMRIGVQSVERE